MAHNKDDNLRLLIEKGLKRSALKAREKALQTNTPLIVEVNGEVQEIKITMQDVQNYREEIKEAL
jgi:hypothetical protein